MFLNDSLFAIEEKESKIDIMKANAIFESSMDNIFLMEKSIDAKSLIQNAKKKHQRIY